MFFFGTKLPNDKSTNKLWGLMDDKGFELHSNRTYIEELQALVDALSLAQHAQVDLSILPASLGSCKVNYFGNLLASISKNMDRFSAFLDFDIALYQSFALLIGLTLVLNNGKLLVCPVYEGSWV